MLGLVDDLIGITDAGYQAQQMNEIINLKTAEKRLQFGASKCKSMLISKKPNTVQNSRLLVDNWNIKHIKNKNTGEIELVEDYDGRIQLEQTDKQKYLGFILSCKGDNMINIQNLKNKSIGIIRKLFNKLESLKLQKYYFECALIFLNVMLRSSILYASETYYGLSEHQIRQIERIEEEFLRKLFKTSKGCPISQLYLEAGHIPARFQIFKNRLLFLKYILEQDSNSLINKFLKLQLNHPNKGDWASSCLKDLKFLEIRLNMEEIKDIRKNAFVSLINISVNKKALEYLQKMRGKKGQEIEYREIKMADYLMPYGESLTISEKRFIFAMRNRMIEIPENFPTKYENEDVNCKQCGKTENMKHVYMCNMNHENKDIQYEKIFGDNRKQMKRIYKQFKTNYENRENMKTIENPPRDPFCDPLISLSEFSNGNIIN